MADLSGVLRKTIDGLPRSTPDMRVRVYEKARAAIRRQIDAANPPLADGIAEARLDALEDAIERTEQHYLDLENGGARAAAAEAFDDGERIDERPHHVEEEAPAELSEARQEHEAEIVQDRLEHAELQPRGAQAEPRAEDDYTGDPHEPVRREPVHSDWSSRTEAQGPDFGNRVASDERFDHPDADGDRFDGREAGPADPSSAYDADDRHVDERFVDRSDVGLDHQGGSDRDGENDDGFVSIPEADVSGPVYVAPRHERRSRKSGPLAGILSLAVIVLGLGAVAWFYGEDLSNALVGSDETVASGTPQAGSQNAAADPSSEAESEGGAPEGEIAGSTRQFTQRLQADGSEVDEGPAEAEANAFGEGTDVAAATPTEDPASEGTSATIASEIGREPEIVGENGAENEESTDAASGANEQPGLAVGQRAVFYQERTSDQPGTQETGNVVWSMVEEPPIEGQPAEPAIRAVAEIPDENMTMTMTIRRNADPTLPASHVIELLFDTPNGFPGGSVATVQRLALKNTEQARGEPLIGVAGKISDGFFIIALNNLDQAVENNLSLLESEEWIDIPIAYETGRRALISVEKGIPGERVFKEAIAAWNART